MGVQNHIGILAQTGGNPGHPSIIPGTEHRFHGCPELFLLPLLTLDISPKMAMLAMYDLVYHIVYQEPLE